MSGDWQQVLSVVLPHYAELTQGDPGNFAFALESVKLRSGEVVPIQRRGITVIVGANNSGKSTILREVSEKLAHNRGFPENPRLAVSALTLATSGTQADMVAWLGENASFVSLPHSVGFQRAMTGVQDVGNMVSAWAEPRSDLGALSQFLVFYGNAQGRFSIGGSAGMRDQVDRAPEHPIHYLQDSRTLLDQVSAITEEVFGTKLTLDTLAATLKLRIGEMKQPAPRIDDIPASYREEMAELRPLDEQGDGMRSLLGQLLPIVSGAYKLVLLDEPEAFLHPPQARALGIQLGRLAAKQDLQVVLATHDRSLLTGLLDSGVDVSIVRLTRDESQLKVSCLDPQELRSVWSDPVLKYSNVLDGLFHRLVVLGEAEGDCAYLAAALEALPNPAPGAIPGEVLFVPTGGKDGMAKVGRALSAVAVPVVAAPDLDMISDCSALKGLVESLGGVWADELQSLWTKATADLRAPRQAVKVTEVLKSINSTLGPMSEELYSSDHGDTLKAALRAPHSPWREVKDYGTLAFKGQASEAVEELIGRLEGLGVVLVRQGELERLAPEVKVRKGPGWLRAAFEAGAQGNQTTQAHVERILRSAALVANRGAASFAG